MMLFANFFTRKIEQKTKRADTLSVLFIKLVTRTRFERVSACVKGM